MATKKTEETIVDVADVYSKTETFVNDNGQKMTYILGAIVALMLCFFLYKKFVMDPKGDEAATQIWKAEYYFEKDSFQLALNGTAEHLGFLDVADSYSGTETGNLANHYAGACYMNLGQYDQAIEYLDKASFGDMMVEATRLGTIGDAHVQLGNLSEGASFYSKSISHSENDFTTPIYLKKLALTYEEMGEKGKAYDTFVRLKEDFGATTTAKDIDKYIGRVAPFAN
jgi:tetratricopeptide (TPR) repeat protein